MRPNRHFAIRANATPVPTWNGALMLLAGLILAALLVAPAYAVAMTPSQYVQTNANEGVSILSDRSLSESDRRSKFRTFILSLVDERRIALFTLGAFRKGTSEPDQDAFVEAFVDYAVATYEANLCKYTDETLKVTDVKELNGTEYKVTTIIDDDSAGQPISVGFRLQKDGDTFNVIDIHIEGVWLAISQRDEFTSLLKKNSGSVPQLTQHVKQLAAKQQALGCAN
jgi:phospholipid transport system substrate-binding protein